MPQVESEKEWTYQVHSFSYGGIQLHSFFFYLSTLTTPPSAFMLLLHTSRLLWPIQVQPQQVQHIPAENDPFPPIVPNYLDSGQANRTEQDHIHSVNWNTM